MARNTIEILFNTVFNGKGSKEANAAIGDTEQKAQGAKSGLDALVGGLTAAGLAYGAVEVAQRTWAAALEGQAAKKEQSRFDALTESIGATGDVLEQLRDVTKGQATDLDLMASANQLMVMGLADSEQSLNDHFRIVSALKKPNEDFGTALENWSLMLANQSIPRLDSFGISSGKVRDRILELQAANADMTREQAFMIATFEEAEGTIDKLGDSVDDAGDPFARLTAKVENLNDKTKILIADALLPAVTSLDNLTDSSLSWRDALLLDGIAAEEAGRTTHHTTAARMAARLATQELADETDELGRSLEDLDAALFGNQRAMAERRNSAELLTDADRDLYLEVLKSTGAIDDNRLAVIENAIANIETGEALDGLLAGYGRLTPQMLSYINQIVALTGQQNALNAADSENIPLLNRIANEVNFLEGQLRELIAAYAQVAQLFGAQTSTGNTFLADDFAPNTVRDLNAIASAMTTFSEDAGNTISQRFGGAVRDLGTDYHHLADTVDSTGERILQIEKNKNARLASEAQRLATFEEGLRDRVTDAWTAYYDEVQRRSDEFTRNQSDEFLGLFDDVQRQAAPTFNDLIRGFADMEAASGDSAEAIRATMDGFLDSESLEAAARIQSFIDSFDALSRSNLNTEDKRKAIEELQRQFAEGETANLAEYGVQIETANEYAKRTTQERLDDVLAMEKDTNERIYEAKEETAARIVTIQQEANADIQKSIEALGDVFGREFGSNVTSAEGLRAKLVEVKGQVDALVGQEYNVVINYVTNGVPGAPSASPAIDPARQAASHIRP